MRLLCCLLLWAPLISAWNSDSHRNELRQYGDSDSEEVDCKQLSLSEPRWYIFDPRYTLHNYSTGGTRGSAGFTALNLPMNQSFNCFFEDVVLNGTDKNATDGNADDKGAARWWNCTVPDTQFTFEVDTMTLGLKQTWVCDNAPNLTFVGGGTASIPMDLGCGSDGNDYFCLYGNTQVRAGLESPLDIVPFEPWRPIIPYEYPEFCVQRSYYPTWEVDDLVYSHAADRRFLSFDLTNLANGRRISCGIRVDEGLTRGSAHKARWVDCDSADTSNTTIPGGVSGTRVLFDRDYSLLGVQQTWQCRNNDTSADPKDAPFIYTGVGYIDSALNCTRPGPYDGVMDSSPAEYTCSLPATNISGYQADDIPAMIPHTSYTPSCTINSMNITHMTLSEYRVETRNSSDAGGRNASFVLFNPGSGDEYGIGDITVQDDGKWHPCGGEADSLPWQLASCEYLLDGGSDKVGFRLGWYCDDRDPRHALIFSATATGSFPKDSCKTANTSGTAVVTSCSLPANSSDGNLHVSALNWTATGKPMDRGPPLPWF